LPAPDLIAVGFPTDVFPSNIVAVLPTDDLAIFPTDDAVVFPTDELFAAVMVFVTAGLAVIRLATVAVRKEDVGFGVAALVAMGSEATVVLPATLAADTPAFGLALGGMISGGGIGRLTGHTATAGCCPGGGGGVGRCSAHQAAVPQYKPRGHGSAGKVALEVGFAP